MVASVVGPDIGIVLFVGVLWLWPLVDSVIRPSWAFREAGSNKLLWMALILLFGALTGAGYLLFVRSRVAAAQRSGRSSDPF